MEKIEFVPEGEKEPVAFYILDQAKLGGRNYLLVTDADPEGMEEDTEGNAYIMKDMADPEADESIYSFVEDDDEIASVCVLFKDTLGDMEIELEE